MSIPDRMTYERAFFLNEERGEPTPFDAAFVLEATCFHEAGHAVAGYMLGFGLSSVSVTVECARLPENPEKLGYRFPGLYMQAKRPTARWGRAIRERGYGHAALAFGCMTCAGPVAELRFLTYNDMPRQMLGATIGDHEAVDRIGKYLDNGGNGRFRPRDRFAFRRLSWREAQKLIHREDVWDAVGELAYALQEGLYDWPEAPGQATSLIPGSTARSIIRRAGIAPLGQE
jgi:hypothetical protein